MVQKTAFITGILGQDGAYLARYLLQQDYCVHGLMRWDSYVDASAPYERFAALGIDPDQVRLHTGDVLDPHGMQALLQHIQPDEIYNLAAISHVAESFSSPSVVMDIITKGTLNVLEAMRAACPSARFYQASSSEIFGAAPAPQNESTAMLPCSPYGVAKLSAYHLVRVYRQSYGLFAANGILFNHESPMRAHDFVTQKIALGVRAITAGQQAILTLGNLDALRDWGHADDYVRGMHLMLAADRADDFVLSTGQSLRVRDFVMRAFACAGMPITWTGSGLNEKGIDSHGIVRVNVSEDFYRPLEVNHLQGDAAKARRVLGWRPAYDCDALVRDMVLGDLYDLPLKRVS